MTALYSVHVLFDKLVNNVMITTYTIHYNHRKHINYKQRKTEQLKTV